MCPTPGVTKILIRRLSPEIAQDFPHFSMRKPQVRTLHSRCVIPHCGSDVRQCLAVQTCVKAEGACVTARATFRFKQRLPRSALTRLDPKCQVLRVRKPAKVQQYVG